jgi:hypothetical protein
LSLRELSSNLVHYFVLLLVCKGVKLLSKMEDSLEEGRLVIF